jgi:hypothetical protein
MNRLILTVLLLGASLHAVVANTFTVTNTNDSGGGSLRQALTDANNNAGADTINFDISGTGQKTITVLSDLPHISETVTIDGGNGGVASNRVQITNGASIATGLEVNSASGTVIRNLVINGFIRQIGLFPGINTTIQGCRLCLNPAGNALSGGGEAIETCCGTSGVLIGGTTAAERNLLAGGASNAAVQHNGGSATIQGNFIGVNAAGTAVVGPPRVGVSISNSFGAIGGLNSGEGNVIVASTNGIEFTGNPALGQSSGRAQGNLIGTDAAGTTLLGPGTGTGVAVAHATGVLINGGNVIAGFGDGININQNGINGNHSDHTTIQGNFIGTAADGVTNLGNSLSGVDNNCPDNIIGGVNAGEGNVIAFNGLAGVHHRGAVNNRTERNSIFSNGGLGIDLDLDGPTLNDDGDADSGGNNLQNFPVLTSVTNDFGMATVNGRLNSAPNTTYRLEFFTNTAIDSTGYGEGKKFFGTKDVTTNGSGNVTFSALLGVLNPGERITATATDPNGNTSEFSGAIGQLTNVSTRMQVLTGNNVLIGGFIVGGSGNIDVLLRALGPTLGQLGVTGFLADPILELHDGSGALIMSNDNWKDTQQATIFATGKAPPSDVESAIRHTFTPGNYTAIVRGKNQTTGVGLVEAYDLNEGISTTLTNISTRGFVDTDQNVMIGGFISGDGIVRVIVRALGPTLTAFNVPNVLADPTLELRDVNGALIASNDNWKDSQQAEIQASGFAPPNNNESAIIMVRPAANTTAIVRGKGNTTGNALVEAYILPP